MKKIGVVTFLDNNYGSMLQSFATKTYIESLGCTCIMLRKTNNSSLWSKIKEKTITYCKMLLHPSFLGYKWDYRKKRYLSCINPTAKTKRQMDKFVREYLQPQDISEQTLKNQHWLNQFDFFITGSDQVWKADLIIDDFFFLKFSPRHKRIALAVSFGSSEIPQYNKKKICSLVNGFDFISVREESGLDIIKKCTTAKVTRIADPTLIYSCDEWRTFAKTKNTNLAKYIFVHFLNEPNSVAINSISWLSESFDLDIIVLGYNYDSFKSINRLTFVEGGPQEYVSLINHAEYVLTDSFHSTLFSINFERKFFTFHRQYPYKSQSSRIFDLLDRYKMKDRLIDDVELLKSHCENKFPTMVKDMIKKERDEIRCFIQESIFGENTHHPFFRG